MHQNYDNQAVKDKKTQIEKDDEKKYIENIVREVNPKIRLNERAMKELGIKGKGERGRGNNKHF